MKQICYLSTILFFLWACGNDSVSQPEEPISENKVCIEGARTTIDGRKYVCEKDEFVPEEKNKNESSSSAKSSSSLNSVVYSSKG